MSRDVATHAPVATTRGLVGVPETTYVLDNFFEASPPVDLDAHTPDTDLEGGGWKTAKWGSAHRVIAGNQLEAVDWANHGANVIDAGVGTDFELTVTMNILAAINYTAIQIGTTGGGVGDHAGWCIAYRPGSNNWGIFDSYPGGGGEGTIDSYAFVADETGATFYEMRVRMTGNNIDVYMDDVHIMTATNAKYVNNTHHGIACWSGSGQILTGFSITSLPTPARVSASPARSEHGLWLNDEFVDSFPTLLTSHDPDFSFIDGGWSEFNSSGTVDAWNVINYQLGSLRRDTGVSNTFYYAYIDVEQSDCVIRSSMRDHQGVNPMWDGFIMRWTDYQNHFYLQLNAESDWIRLYRMEAAVPNQIDHLAIAVEPADQFDLTITLDGNDFTIDVIRNNGVAVGQLAATDSFQSGATRHGVYNRPMNGFNPWTYLDYSVRDS